MSRSLFSLFRTQGPISSSRKSNSLFLRVGFAPFWSKNWKLDLKIYFTLFGFAFFQKQNRGNCYSLLFLLITKRAKRAIHSHYDSLSLRFTLIKKSERVICSFCKKEQLARKTKERIPNPILFFSKFLGWNTIIFHKLLKNTRLLVQITYRLLQDKKQLSHLLIIYRISVLLNSVQ